MDHVLFMNKEIRRVIGNTAQFVLETKCFQHNDKGKLFTLNELLATSKVGKHHFNFNPDIGEAQSRSITVEIDIKEHKFNREPCLMVQIRNVTSAMDSYAL